MISDNLFLPLVFFSKYKKLSDDRMKSLSEERVGNIGKVLKEKEKDKNYSNLEVFS